MKNSDNQKSDTKRETPLKKKKFEVSPATKMRLAIEVISRRRKVAHIGREAGVSRTSLYAWAEQLLSRRSAQAVFGDYLGRGAFDDVLAERDELRAKMRKGTRNRSLYDKRKKCPHCQQWYTPLTKRR